MYGLYGFYVFQCFEKNVYGVVHQNSKNIKIIKFFLITKNICLFHSLLKPSLFFFTLKNNIHSCIQRWQKFTNRFLSIKRLYNYTDVSLGIYGDF